MAPTRVTPESSESLFSLLLSTWGSGVSVFVCAGLFTRFCVYPFLPPMSPKGLVVQLRAGVTEATALFQEHSRLLLANAADINIELTCLEADTFALERALLDDSRRSLGSFEALVFYLRRKKRIWINAHRCRRKINALKNRMEILIIQDREGRLRDTVAGRCSGLTMNYNGWEASNPLFRSSGGAGFQVEQQDLRAVND